MTVLRRLDAVLEDSKQDVLDMEGRLDDTGVVEQDAALRQAAGRRSTTLHRYPNRRSEGGLNMTRDEVRRFDCVRTMSYSPIKSTSRLLK